MVRVINRQWVVLEEREGGLPPGSPEAVAAIERVRKLLNPDTVPASTPPAWSIKEPDSPEFRTCERCGAGVKGKKLCKPCQANVRAEEQMAGWSPEMRATASRPSGRQKTANCLTCGCDISHLNTFQVRCHECRIKAKQEAGRLYYERHQQNRTCITCKVSIAGLPETRVRCDTCQAEKNEGEARRRAGLPRNKTKRSCRDCGADISERHGATIRCFRCANAHVNQSRTKQRKSTQGQVSA